MPASITRARVASRPYVAGRSRLMPASGPTPGSTPTSVPTRQPMKPYQRTWGLSATEKPSPRFWRVSSTSEAEGAAGEGNLEKRVEEVERSPGHDDGDGEAERPAAALEEQDQEGEHHRHGDAVAQALEPPGREPTGREDRDSVPPLVPADLAEPARARAQHEDGE